MADKVPTATTSIIPLELIERKIYLIRGVKVMLDADLADLYQVTTKRLNEAVKRNLHRFPEDFMFQLSIGEADGLRLQPGSPNLRSQFATSSYGGRRYRPYAFTEHGVAMLSSVLNSDRAVQMNILIVRAFVKMRELLASNKDLAVRVEKLEASQQRHASVLALLADEIDTLKVMPPEPPKEQIGFRAKDEK